MRSIDQSEMALRASLEKNTFEMCIISLPDLKAITSAMLPGKKSKSIWKDYLKPPINSGLNYMGTIDDTITVNKSLFELYRKSGVTPAQVKSRMIGAGYRAAIAIQGAGVKGIVKTLQRYSYALVNQLTTLNMVMGRRYTVTPSVGAKYSIIFAVPFTFLDTIFQDEPTWSYFLGNLASSFLKTMASTSISEIIIGGTIATLTLGEFVLFIAFGAMIIYGLELIDQKLQLTDKLVKQLRIIAQGTVEMVHNSANHDIEKFNDSLRTTIGMSQLKGNSLRW